MLTAITYNCDPESLADVDQDDFVDAFENAVRSRPIYRDLAVTVTFDAGRSQVTNFASDDFDADVSHEDQFRDEFQRLAEKAFAAANGG